jgi:cytochrome o ubiquinol oxidase subunit 2
MNSMNICFAVMDTFLQPAGPVAEAQLEHLNYVVFLTLIAVVPPLVATPLILWWFRRGNKRATYRPKWDSNLPLECLMWGVPVVVVALMGVSLWNMTMRLDPYKHLAEDPLEIQVVGLNWKWLFIYPDEGVALVDELVIPENRAVELLLTSDTVMQSLRISAIVGQIYAMPAMTTKLNFIAAKQGEIRGMNTQFTGTGFWQQKFDVRSVSVEEYQERMERARQSNLALTAETYAILASQGTADDAKQPLGIANHEGPIEMRLADADIFNRVLARYFTGTPLTPETQPGSPAYQLEKAVLPPASMKPSMNM